MITLSMLIKCLIIGSNTDAVTITIGNAASALYTLSNIMYVIGVFGVLFLKIQPIYRVMTQCCILLPLKGVKMQHRCTAHVCSYLEVIID